MRLIYIENNLFGMEYAAISLKSSIINQNVKKIEQRTLGLFFKWEYIIIIIMVLKDV